MMQGREPMPGMAHLERQAFDLSTLANRVTAVERELPAKMSESLLTTSGQLVTFNGTSVVAEARAVVSALPSSPYNGMRIAYQNASMATDGIVWKLQYRSAGGTYKWEFIGGPAWQKEVLTDEATASTTYVALTTALEVATPLAGDYLIAHGCNLRNSGTATTLASFAVGGTAASDDDSIDHTGVANEESSPYTQRRKDGIAASSVIAARYRTTATTANFRRRVLSILPIRLG
jgi:hypothetical protein